MSKFIAQLLLSAVIGIGATVGFKSGVNGELKKTLLEAKVVFHEKANIDLKSPGHAKTRLNTSVPLSSKGKAAISVNVAAKADSKEKGRFNLQPNTEGAISNNLIPGVSLAGTVNLDSQTNFGSNLADLQLDLGVTINDTLELGPLE